jgi:transcriptional regulator with XRE-family HTH domain
MAESLHIEQSTYSKYEAGKLTLNTEIAKRIADTYDVDLNWLLSNNGNTYNVETNNGNIGDYHTYNEAPKELIAQILKQQELLNQLLQKMLLK